MISYTSTVHKVEATIITLQNTLPYPFDLGGSQVGGRRSGGHSYSTSSQVFVMTNVDIVHASLLAMDASDCSISLDRYSSAFVIVLSQDGLGTSGTLAVLHIVLSSICCRNFPAKFD